MKIFKKKSELKAYLSNIRENEESIGFVPTMGALHEGHLSLIKHAQKKNSQVVVSIFVNPTQFDNKEDLEKYPNTLDRDIKLLESINCDVLYAPATSDVYERTVVSDKFNFDGLENKMEGAFRDGHFDGVGTIVKALFEIIEPNKAYFGEKDFQQLQIVKKMVEKYKLPVKVKGRPIFREEDGLAMSSRNERLTKEHREAAPYIYRILRQARKKFGSKKNAKIIKWVTKQFDKHSLLTLEYFTIAEERTLESSEKIESSKKYRGFIAVFAGEIRLIDNIRF